MQQAANHQFIAVTIQEEPEEIKSPEFRSGVAPGSPSPPGSHSPKIHRASISGRKLGGRPSFNRDASATSLAHQLSAFSLDGADGDRDGLENRAEDPNVLLSQVIMWLHEEKAKRSPHIPKSTSDDTLINKERPGPSGEPRQGSGNKHPNGSLALDKLERILAGYMISGSNVAVPGRRGSVVGRRKSSITRKAKRGLTVVSSDTEYQDGELLVPNVETVLDNSKIVNNPAAQTDNDITTVKSKDKDQWNAFKCEVVRLTHTLRLKGWTRLIVQTKFLMDYSYLYCRPGNRIRRVATLSQQSYRFMWCPRPKTCPSRQLQVTAR